MRCFLARLCRLTATGKDNILFERITEKVVAKSRQTQTQEGRLSSLIRDEIFFLLIAPWMLILPAFLLTRRVPSMLPAAAESAIGWTSAVLGLSYSLWAVRVQWRVGGGTPSLNAPPQKLVTSGPYRFSRNPIQLGALLYIFGLGTAIVSVACGASAGAVSLLVGLVYIKGVEEKELAARFGAAYLAYRSRTPFLLPIGARPLRGLHGQSTPRTTSTPEGTSDTRVQALERKSG